MLITILNAIYIISIIALIYSMGWLLVRGNQNKLTYSFLLCQLLIILWCGSQITNNLSVNCEQLMLSYKIGYLGICFISPSWLIFSIIYCGITIDIKKIIIIYLIPIFHYIMMVTNKFHSLFYNKFEMHEVKYGVIFYSNVISVYVFTIISLIIIIKRYKKECEARFQMIALVLSEGIPFIVNALYLFEILPVSFDLTPAAFSLSAILVIFTLYKYNFLNINSIAFEKGVRDISEGIIIFNNTGLITYMNKVVENFFVLNKKENISKIYKIIEKYNKDFCYKDDEPFSEVIITLKNGKTINIKRYNHYNNKKMKKIVATTLILTDMTKYYELLNNAKELALSNQQLAIEKERNRIAQEVHDTTGHTLTMIQSLAKIAQIEYEQGNDENLLEYLKEAKQLSSNGIKELRVSINNLKEKGKYELLTEQINSLVKGVKEIYIDLCIQGEDSIKYSHLSTILYECLREAITNCLRYANADRMDVIMKLHEDKVEMFIFDNGDGCMNIKDGNGLSGIKNRILSVKGEVIIKSNINEGFQMVIKVPLTANK